MQTYVGAYKTCVKQWNGADWVQLGSVLTTQPRSISSFKIANGSPVVLYTSFDEGVVVKSWTGATWSAQGTLVSQGDSAKCQALALRGTEPLVAIGLTSKNYRLSVLRYSSGAWKTVGNAGFSPGQVSDVRIELWNGVPVVVFKDESDGKAYAMRLR